MTELVAEFSSVEYLTDTKLSRFTWIPVKPDQQTLADAIDELE
jgi:hypothetical protein